MADTPVPTGGADGPDAAAVHDDARLRGPKRLLLVGPPGAFVVAFASGLLGLDGDAGFLLFLLLLAAIFGVTGLWVGGGLLLDEFREAPTSGRRVLLAVAMFIATLVCMIAVGGVSSSTGSGA